MPSNPDAKYICPMSGKDVQFQELPTGQVIIASPHGWKSKVFKNTNGAKTWFRRFFDPSKYQVEETKKPGWYRAVGKGWFGKQFHHPEIVDWWATHLRGQETRPYPGITSVRERVRPENVDEGLEIDVEVDEEKLDRYLEGKDE